MNGSLEHFAELVTREQFSIAEACLMISQDEYPAIDIAACLARLDSIADTVRGRIAADAFAEQKVATLNHHLFDELGFAGNADAYYDPRNSYLNEVLERRTGIPITLAIVYLEVGRRLGLRVQGISFPGHFLVKLKVPRGELVLDPFARGEAQSAEDLRQRLSQMMPAGHADAVELDAYLAAASPRQIVARLLRNLKNIYLESDRLEQALAVMQRMLLVHPESAEELRDRGVIYMKLECFRPALADLQNYLRRRPDAPDIADVRAQVVELKAACARLN